MDVVATSLDNRQTAPRARAEAIASWLGTRPTR